MADAGTTTTYVGPTPGSGQYGMYQAQAENAYASAIQQIGSQRGQFLSQQGLTGQYDGSGNFTGFDYGSDPNGAYQQMNAHNAGQGAADDAAIGATGFRGGLVNQQHEAAQSAYSQNATNWATNAQGQLNQYQQQGIQAGDQYTNSLFDGLNTSIQTAIQNGTYNPADYSGLSIDGQAVTPPPGAGPPAGGTTDPGAWKPPTNSGGPTGATGGMGAIGGKTVWGYGTNGQPFFSKAAATAAGRLGKGKHA